MDWVARCGRLAGGDVAADNAVKEGVTQMGRRHEPVMLELAFELFEAVPWCVGPPMVGMVFGAFWVMPLVFPEKDGLHFREQILHGLAWIAAAVVAFAWLVALVAKAMRRRR